MTDRREAFPAQPETQFLVSNMVVPPATIVFGGISAHKRYLHAVGADGLEITPLYPRTSRLMAQLEQRSKAYTEGAPGAPLHDDGCSRGDQDIRRLVKSLHSGFCQEEGGLAAYVFPPVRDSLTFLTRIQRLTGKLPAVLFPNISDGTDYLRYNDQNAPFAWRTFQPKAHEWQGIFGLGEYSSTEEVREAIGAYGYNGLTGDVFHDQNVVEGMAFKDLPSFVGRMAQGGIMHEAHLSLNRTDITGRTGEAAEKTRAAKRAFMDSPKAALSTIEGQQLQAIASGWKAIGHAGVVVYEEGPLRSPLAPTTYDEQQRILATAREIVVQAPAA